MLTYSLDVLMVDDSYYLQIIARILCQLLDSEKHAGIIEILISLFLPKIIHVGKEQIFLNIMGIWKLLDLQLTFDWDLEVVWMQMDDVLPKYLRAGIC